MHAPITTAARRLVRTARTHRHGYRLYFDTDGHLVTSIYGPEAFDPRRDTYAVQVSPQVTQQDAADALSSYALALAAGVSLRNRWALDDAWMLLLDMPDRDGEVTAADMRAALDSLAAAGDQAAAEAEAAVYDEAV